MRAAHSPTRFPSGGNDFQYGAPLDRPSRLPRRRYSRRGRKAGMPLSGYRGSVTPRDSSFATTVSRSGTPNTVGFPLGTHLRFQVTPMACLSWRSARPTSRPCLRALLEAHDHRPRAVELLKVDQSISASYTTTAPPRGAASQALTINSSPSTPSATPYSSRRRRPWCTIPRQLAIIASPCFISPQTAFST
jgi:hypothetical protein